MKPLGRQHENVCPPLSLFKKIALIRSFEERVLELFSEGKVQGTTHTCLGQEATAVAAAAFLAENDIVFCPHRCHGYYLSYGGSAESLMAELMGRRDGVCGGRGGSQHLHYKNFFSSGIQGGIVGNAVGAALARKMTGGEGIVLVFLGDGTLGEGLVYESMNFAALHSLPVLFVLENNQYAQTTPVQTAVSGSITARAEAFGIPAFEVETNDVFELLPVFQERISTVRTTRSPAFQVVNTYRLGPHSKGDDHRDKEEILKWRKKDPLLLARRHVKDADAQAALDEAANAVSAAVAAAEQSAPASGIPPVPSPAAVSMSVPWVDEDITYVHSLNRALHSLLESYPDVFLLGEDVLDPYGGAFAVAKGLSTRFPSRVISTPISEAGIAAWSTGAALAGMRPIAEIMFGDFLALAADQLLNHATKYGWVAGNKVRVPMVVRVPMGGGRGYGPTHSQSIEGMFCGIPGLTVVSAPPMLDAGELIMRAVLHANNPVLFIEHKNLYPKPLLRRDGGRLGLFSAEADTSFFPTVRLRLVDESPDAAIVTYGGNVPTAMEAARLLMLEHEISVDLVVVSQLSPVPTPALASFVKSAPIVVTLEEGPKSHGWGSGVIAALAEELPYKKYLPIGAAACPIPAARSMECEVLPGVSTVVEAIMRYCK